MVADRLMWLITGACVVWARPRTRRVDVWSLPRRSQDCLIISPNRAAVPRHDRDREPYRLWWRLFSASAYYGFRAGVFPRQSWWGIEGEFIHLKVVADTSQNTKFDGVLRGQNASSVRALASVVQQFSSRTG
jgi:hypothetical protein